MSTEYNLCPKCGGIKGKISPELREQLLLSTRFSASFPACSCRSAPTPKHEITYGDLGDHAAVFHDESWVYDQIAIRAKGEVRIHLSPQQFLLLLDWGTSRRPAIERLAKERE